MQGVFCNFIFPWVWVAIGLGLDPNLTQLTKVDVGLWVNGFWVNGYGL